MKSTAYLFTPNRSINVTIVERAPATITPIAKLFGSEDFTSFKQAPTGSILYQVSTLYGKDESKKADADKEVNVGNEKIILSETTISPTVFTDQVELFGNEKVDLLEVITLDGKTVIRQKNPGKIVYTGSLSSGIYIFRIHTDGKAKTMKAQKIN